MKTQKYWSVYGKKTHNTSKTMSYDYIQLFREMLSMLEKVPQLGMHDEDHDIAASTYIQGTMETIQELLHGAEATATTTTTTPARAAEEHTSRRGVHTREAFTQDNNAGQPCSMHAQREKFSVNQFSSIYTRWKNSVVVSWTDPYWSLSQTNHRGR